MLFNFVMNVYSYMKERKKLYYVLIVAGIAASAMVFAVNSVHKRNNIAPSTDLRKL